MQCSTVLYFLSTAWSIACCFILLVMMTTEVKSKGLASSMILNYSKEFNFHVLFHSTVAGPFLVAFGTKRKTIYLTLTGDYTVKGTTNKEDGRPFNILPLDGAIPHEFMITSNLEEANEGEAAEPVGPVEPVEEPVDEADGGGEGAEDEDTHYMHAEDEKERGVRNVLPHYLEAKVDFTGTNPHYSPLRMRSNLKIKNASLALQSRVLKPGNKLPANIDPWLKGKESFYIKCVHRGFGKTGYLCARKIRARPPQSPQPQSPGPQPHQHQPPQLPEEYKLTIVSSIRAHNEGDDVYMLFRLLTSEPPKKPQGGLGVRALLGASSVAMP